MTGDICLPATPEKARPVRGEARFFVPLASCNLDTVLDLMVRPAERVLTARAIFTAKSKIAI